MADDDFYTHDRPDDAKLPEDRPRGGGPEDFQEKEHRRGKPVWMVIGLVVVVIVLLALFMP